MAVAYDASSALALETTISPATIVHIPASTPKGVLAFIINADDTVDHVSSVTYGGTTMSAVSGGIATTSAGGEDGLCKAYFLGSSVPTGTQTLSVSFTGSKTTWVAVITVTASGDTEVYTSGISLIQEVGTLAEVSVNDGSPGTNSTRFGGLFTGLATPPSAGANSTVIQSRDIASIGGSVVRETTAGQGARSIGWSSGTSDDRAAVLLAIREVAGGGAATIFRKAYNQPAGKRPIGRVTVGL